MSQRECAGFNWPPLSIPAEEPVSISPVTVSRAGWAIAAAMHKSCGDPLRSISLTDPSSVRMFFSPSACRGVGQPAKFACLGNWSNRSDPSALGLMSPPVSFQSLVVVVVQPASFTAPGSFSAIRLLPSGCLPL